MPRSFLEILQDSGRSIVGGLIFGLPLLYTMETWWLAWRLPMWLLLAFSLGGLLLISVTVRYMGFREDMAGKSDWGEALQGFVQLVLHSLLGAYGVLLLFGIIEWGDSLQDVLRHAAIQLVPFGLGAAIANRMLQSRPDDKGEHQGGGDAGARSRTTMRSEAAVFVLGAIFFSLPVAPTEEMELMAAHAGWWRLVLVPALALLLTYLALYELEFRGSAARAGGRGRSFQHVGEVFGGYTLALAVAALILAGFGHFVVGSFEEVVQKTVVLSFLASIGGAAARVVI